MLLGNPSVVNAVDSRTAGVSPVEGLNLTSAIDDNNVTTYFLQDGVGSKRDERSGLQQETIMRKKMCFFAAAVALLACACGGDSGGSTSQSATQSPIPTSVPTAAPPSVSQSDLPGMVLTADDLSAPYGDFVLDPTTSGVRPRDVVINDACDPQRQARELDSTNWVAEYASEWGPADETAVAPDGTFIINSSVDLFQNEAGAAAAFQDMIADELRWANSQCNGANIGSVEAFDFPTIGDESWGANATATFSGVSGLVSAVMTNVISRRGQVVISENTVRFGGQGLPDEAVRLARLIVQRMSGSPNL
ncbi:MAG: hypothetical protein ABSG55_07095 [Dehalococcoidia bacterium]|jgi:hypothetical protein